MSKHVVVVESPAKAKTIKKYLGNDFEVLASYGHVRDLLPKEGAVDTAHDFAMTYEVISKNARHVDAIIKALKGSDVLYLATDPDREGEAISWHIYELLKERKILKDKPVHRVVFHEITRTAVQDAVANPRELSMDLVNAQQARRALDYLVGFNLSPLLWKKIRRGLSAGRVQSPALRLIVERELAIEQFESREYWTVDATAQVKEQAFTAKLVEYAGEKIEQFSLTTAEQAQTIEQDLLQRANGVLEVSNVEKKQRKRHPAAPFITSTLQQEAVRKLGFTAQRAMRTAQQLYEGVDIGEGSVGLITYMRTDSVNLAQEAIDDIRDFISRRYGAEQVPEQARVYKTKSKNAQEAHEAIRPTSIHRTPEQLKESLTADQFKLYSLIWKRTLASQMLSALIDTVAVDLLCGSVGYRFRANGSAIAMPGFITVYQEGVDDSKKLDGDENFLPNMQKGDQIPLQSIIAAQHFTEPPPRYSEASLVKALEEFGIGRPSTYASIISTLQQREYVDINNKRFIPTDVGRVVTRFLTQHFTRYVDYDFTAKLEDELDAVARGEQEWVPLMHNFWGTFKSQVVDVEKNVQRKDVTQESLDEKCPKCDAPLAVRLGRRGRFVGCTAYPECDYTRDLGDGSQSSAAQAEIVADRKCPECQSDLLIKTGKYGKFIGCSGYPNCHFIEPLEKPEDTQVECPVCHKGNLLKRRSKRGKIFYSCSAYPQCAYALWDLPLAEPCPQCAWPILTLKSTKVRGLEKICPQKDCGFVENLPEPDTSDGVE